MVVSNPVDLVDPVDQNSNLQTDAPESREPLVGFNTGVICKGLLQHEPSYWRLF